MSFQDCGKGLNAANKNERALMFQVRNGPVCYNFDNNTLGVVSTISLVDLRLSSILVLFYYLAPPQNDSIVTSQCVQFTFGDKGELYMLDKSALSATEKESELHAS